MNIFSRLATALRSEVPAIFHSATAQVIAIQDTAPPAATGKDKHEFVMESLRGRFASQLAALGDLAHNALDIIVRTAFAEAKKLMPEIFAPVMDAAELATETAIAKGMPAPVGKQMSAMQAVIATPTSLRPQAPTDS